MLNQATNLLASLAVQQAKVESFFAKAGTIKSASDFSDSFNPEWWAANDGIEFADYSEGADLPEQKVTD